MKKTIVLYLVSAMLLLPSLSIAATEIETLNSLAGSRELLGSSGSGCAKWEQQCKEDPFDPGKMECSQRCLQYVDDQGNATYGDSSGSSLGERFEMDPLKTLAGLVLVGLVLWWALSAAG
jgi:hypothetical protein